ncbi:NAD(P)/FAD-dependent oxidoreductase [Streptomyces flavofungini]|uniref:FAD/NAD(P)-dependent oxidoreductase n=1 Tax=Streptomyces flavofungini TaxID=68200 RepID=UPI0025B0E4E1|nr:NAD(P)/FAD-dependent oxidoreductase [Streptomyces flavofungini]WJV50715.1 NAD(P)/FAD-dependent oxidoreductase [Streptomyces flavofungini]
MSPSASEPAPRSADCAEPSGLYDLAVIGAGSAGLAGAVTAAELGLSVALLDSSSGTGGQFYRHPVPATGALRPEALHHDWAAYAGLRRRLEASAVTHLGGHHVWTVAREGGAEDGRLGGTRGGPDVSRDGRQDRSGGGERPWTVHAVTGADGCAERPVRVRARAVLLATGAYERQLPFPGWTLPGVVGAGGAQAMLKSGLVLPGKRVVVAGSGPLLLAVASSLAAAGARVPAVVEASGYLGYARHPRVLAANPHKLAEAVLHGSALLRHRVRLRTRSAVTEVHGRDRVEAVTVTRLDRDWRPLPGTARRIACDALAVGHGLVPQIELATTLGCATRATPDRATALVLDEQQRTSVPDLWAAGETGGIGGAQLARVEGEVAGLAIASRLGGRPARPARVRELQRRRDRMRAFADAMAAAHAPGSAWSRWLTDDTDVCRCEEVTAGSIRTAVADLGARDARTVKLFTRAGMGWCQGRMCGAGVACLAAGAGPVAAPAERRPLAVPVPLGALASLDEPSGEPSGGPGGGSSARPAEGPPMTHG